MCSKFPVLAVISAVVSNVGYMMPSFFFHQRLGQNAEIYIDMLRAAANSSMDCNRMDFFMQDVIQKDACKAPHSTLTSLMALAVITIVNVSNDALIQALMTLEVA